MHTPKKKVIKVKASPHTRASSACGRGAADDAEDACCHFFFAG